MMRQKYFWISCYISAMCLSACTNEEVVIQVGNRNTCTDSADCTNPKYPICRDNHCVANEDDACTSDSDCTDPAYPVCEGGECVATPEEPAKAECTSDSDCTDPARPVCKGEKCVATPEEPAKAECTSDSDCTDPARPVCEGEKCVASPEEPAKAECTSDLDCTDPARPVCEGEKCVAKPEEPVKAECTSDLDCTDPARPSCNSGKCAAIKAEADLLDVIFNEDTSATNIAPTPLVVQTVKGEALTTSFNDVLNRYSAYFGNKWSEAASNYYRIDYASVPEFMEKFADGHTVEIVAKLGQAYPGATSIKPFGSINDGGFAMMLTGTNADSALSYVLVTDGGTSVASSGIKPSAGRYYHLVGTWDEQEMKMYVNGELVKTTKTTGKYKANSDEWIAIGSNTTSTANVPQSWNGDVAIARIYSEPLSAERIKGLYEASNVAETAPLNIENIDALGTGEISVGYEYYIYGSGFLPGDVVRFESLTGGQTYTAQTRIDGDHITAIIPDGMVTDEYRSVLVRGSKTAELTSGKLTVEAHAPMLTRTKCVAHQGGHWASLPGGSESSNSIAALKAAQELDVFAVELDIRRSKDGVIYVAHDDTTGGYKISDTASSTIDSKSKLGNGEHIPRFEAFLDQAKQKPTVKLIVELKQYTTELRTGAYQLVKDKGMLDQVWWLIDTANTKMRDVVENPDTPVLVMSGDGAYSATGACTSWDADKANGMGLTVNYGYGCVTDKHISQSHANGKLVGVWTVNLDDTDSRCPASRSCFRYWINKDIDLITTNASSKLMARLKVYAKDPKTMN